MSPQANSSRSTPLPAPQGDVGRQSTRRTLLRWLGLGALGAPFIGCAPASQTRREEESRVRYVTSNGNARRPPGPPCPQNAGDAATAVPPEQSERSPIPPHTRAQPPQPILRPPRLPRRGVIGLVAPAGVVHSGARVRGIVERFEELGLRVRLGRHIYQEYGFLAGTDRQRADDLMAMFQDPNVDAIMAIRGGWGCARILPLLDYGVIRDNPKPLIGYSDVTSLLLAIYQHAGLITFHGPVGITRWRGDTARSFKDILFSGHRLVLRNRARSRQERPRTVRGGVAQGRLVGGNLSVIAAMAGTDYLPDTAGHIVFFEEVREEAYRIDRLLVQLEQAGWLGDAAGVLFGQCRRCSADEAGVGADWVISEHLARHPAPSWYDAPIGHVAPVYTIPIGLPARTDASAGMLETLGAAVV